MTGRHPSFLIRLLLLGIVAVALQACASPASTVGMTAARDAALAVPESAAQTVSIGAVTGGEATNPLWTSEVGNEEFEAALSASLQNNGLLSSSDDESFVLDAGLIDVQQPLIGLSLEVVSTVEYSLYDKSRSEQIFKETIVVPYTASMSDSYFAIQRLRLANEGSIRSNIEAVIPKLVDAIEKHKSSKGTPISANGVREPSPGA